MPSLVVAITGVMAGVLLWAGLEKARAVTSLSSGLQQLGIPVRITPLLARIVIAVELVTGVGLIYRPSVAVLATVAILAVIFAGAGLIALVRGQRIACGCFGPLGSRVLGRDQLVALPLWLGGTAFLAWQDATPAVLSGPQLLVAVALAMMTLRAAGALRSAISASGDRRSARDMYIWLHR
jgi:methylamine utilization protein MauE